VPTGELVYATGPWQGYNTSGIPIIYQGDTSATASQTYSVWDPGFSEWGRRRTSDKGILAGAKSVAISRVPSSYYPYLQSINISVAVIGSESINIGSSGEYLLRNDGNVLINSYEELTVIICVTGLLSAFDSCGNPINVEISFGCDTQVLTSFDRNRYSAYIIKTPLRPPPSQFNPCDFWNLPECFAPGSNPFDDWDPTIGIPDDNDSPNLPTSEGDPITIPLPEDIKTGYYAGIVNRKLWYADPRYAPFSSSFSPSGRIFSASGPTPLDLVSMGFHPRSRFTIGSRGVEKFSSAIGLGIPNLICSKGSLCFHVYVWDVEILQFHEGIRE
jgi:hypothetical protein